MTADIVVLLRQQWPFIPYHRDDLHREAADEIERLRAICVSAHDRLLRGDDDRELLALLATGWATQAQREAP